MSRALSLSISVLSILLACVFAGTTYAALLAEVGTDVGGFDPSPPATDSLQYSFSVLSLVPTPVSAQWARQVSSADIGSTFEANAGLVESFKQALTRPTADVTIGIHRISNSNPLDQLQAGAWPECCNIVTFRKFVPDITKIQVNRLTMTINSFSFQRFGDNANFAGSHTIRIYGVPEPGFSCTLLGVGLLFGASRSRP